jgi:hypothetical protein
MSPDRCQLDGSVFEGDGTPADCCASDPVPAWTADPAAALADGALADVLADLVAAACLLMPSAGWTCASIPRKQTITAIAMIVLRLIACKMKYPFRRCETLSSSLEYFEVATYPSYEQNRGERRHGIERQLP